MKPTIIIILLLSLAPAWADLELPSRYPYGFYTRKSTPLNTNGDWDCAAYFGMSVEGKFKLQWSTNLINWNDSGIITQMDWTHDLIIVDHDWIYRTNMFWRITPLN